MFKKKDLLILMIILIIITGGFIFNHIYFNQSANYVQIAVNNQAYQTVSLDTKQTIKINDTNTIIVDHGTVTMIEATCRDHLCINQGTISKNGQQIICLPNHVVVSIVSTQENSVDASTN